MKSLLSILFFLVSAAMPLTASAADSEWIFYVYESSTGSDLGTFQTTSTSNVFVLENVSIPNSGNGFNFMIRNSSWYGYGWADGGSVTETGVEYPVASANQATGWSTLPAGTYDVTFNLNALTIQFDVHPEPADWYLYVYSETYSLNGDLGQFKTTGTDGVFLLEDC